MATSHENQCKVCLHGPESLDWGMSNAALSQVVDCSKDSIRRHRKWAQVNGFLPETVAKTSGDESGGPEWRARRKWQAASGEWMYSYEAIHSEVEALIDDSRIDSIIRDWPVQGLGFHRGGDEFAFPADEQLGKAGEAGGGTPETIQRFQQSIEEVAARWSFLRPEHGYLCSMGDLIENIYSTPSQISTNDRTLPGQIEDAVALYMNALGRLLPLVGTLHHATVTSNHGEARSAPKINPYGSENDWGLFIQRIIQGKCKDRGWDVVFHRPDHNEDTTVIRVSDGTEVALNHGHHSGSPQRVKEWVKNQIVGRRPGCNARVLVMGHYHHDFHFPVGSDVTVFGTPALDGGSGWFTRKTGESSPPGIMALTIQDGKWRNHSIL